ncbi:MsnO8 family LLM class oxidoreductase [Methylobacterium nonmethylotrophicum]|uniref:MsnO8 family LLM class oxidoreductase n=1 Tax=Methylobacterium nonmethylotrophicum TaxID=1141884 RepID=A0A4Z0NIK9_9HYPH|nr:MsnO8 family LLM class oxidoreductase [Methylobacterium nonmethylotrophicum]TGD96173.1 MsnO8 family LLM class oxidoreductase [Methylobacterium nonmethylotrophicum]
MTYRLSLLDKSPLLPGEPATAALQRTIVLAQAAERLGYARFWVAEHHANPGLAGTAPEVLIAHLAARTQRIRLGSGGVLLPHYSPYKVAETFNLLAALAPNRIDLGIGKAPGGLPDATRALRRRHDPADHATFDDLLAELDRYLAPHESGLREGTLRALPTPPAAPERFLLGASPDSARTAAALGWRFVFAGQLNGDPRAIEASLEACAQAGAKDSPLLAVTALAALSHEEARALTDPLQVVRVTLPDGQSVNLGSEAQASEFARQAGAASYRTEIRRPHVLSGTADEIRAELDRLHARFGVEEFVVDTPPSATGRRLASVTLIAGGAPALAA